MEAVPELNHILKMGHLKALMITIVLSRKMEEQSHIILKARKNAHFKLCK
jgi:hypothetical protein